ncbi:LysE family transporter [Sulfurovum sp.]|uniref:LysE family transporter n=1 Tax=Sulfurovum sp. TaxID=1969726 RepID=UPI002867F5FA|nr:LysE family transporter [Sulfurovum sp.]
MTYYMTIGIILGLSAGFAPGPLLTLVISETLQHDIKSGIKVALAPIITDLPIIIFTLFILNSLSNFHYILGIISLTGGFFVLYMGYESIRSKGYQFNLQKQKSNSLTKGILANALSPYPYLFWLSVGGPIMTKAITLNIFSLIFFIGGFYIFLIGSKVLLAILVGKSKSFLIGDVYIYIMRFLGLALVVLAFALFIDGLKLLGVLAA